MMIARAMAASGVAVMRLPTRASRVDALRARVRCGRRTDGASHGSVVSGTAAAGASREMRARPTRHRGRQASPKEAIFHPTHARV